LSRRSSSDRALSEAENQNHTLCATGAQIEEIHTAVIASEAKQSIVPSREGSPRRRAPRDAGEGSGDHIFS
jgi:hypothetical protein